MEQSKEVHVEILHFRQHLTRSDVQRVHWVRFDVGTLGHPDFFSVTGNEFKAWFHFITVAGLVKQAVVRINVEHASHLLRISSDEILSMLQKLKDKRLKLLNEHEFVQKRHESVQVEKRREEENREDKRREENINTVGPSRKNAHQSTKDTFPFNWESIPKDAIKKWESMYCPEYIKQQIPKIEIYLMANPAKNRKSLRGWFSFLAGWYDRSWHQFQRNLPSHQSGGGRANNKQKPLLGQQRDINADDEIKKLNGEEVDESITR